MREGLEEGTQGAQGGPRSHVVRTQQPYKLFSGGFVKLGFEGVEFAPELFDVLEWDHHSPLIHPSQVVGFLLFFPWGIRLSRQLGEVREGGGGGRTGASLRKVR